MDQALQGNTQNAVKSQEEIQVWLVNQVSGLIFMEPDLIDVHAPFNGYGLSSRDAVMLSGDLEEWLNCRLSPTLVYEYPSISALAEHLGNHSNQNPNGEMRNQLAANQPGLADPRSSAPPSASLEERLTNLEQLSDDEAEALLLEQLNKLKPT